MYFNNMNTITSFVNAPCVTFYAELAIHFFFSNFRNISIHKG